MPENNEIEKFNTEDSIDKPRERKRIQYKPIIRNVIEDPMELKANKSSQKARRVFTEIESVTIDLWFDKHYLDRNQHGDELGKREGINNDIVESLVKRSLKHMIAYSTLVKGFNFLNQDLKSNERPLRIVLQQETQQGMLNVVIEAHFLDVSRYEITVKTAMCKDNYQLSDNQYSIALMEDGSFLRKCDLKTTKEVCSI
jgi:hypothetical protein